MSAGLRPRIDAFLQAHHVMSLATSGLQGPWSAAVFYANDGLLLYFLSAPGSRHSRDIEARGRAPGRIHNDGGGEGGGRRSPRRPPTSLWIAAAARPLASMSRLWRLPGAERK